MDIKLNEKDAFGCVAQGVYQYRENPCITYSLYQYKQSSTGKKKPNYINFTKRKLSRKFIADIDVYSNNQSCSLYNYCALYVGRYLIQILHKINPLHGYHGKLVLHEFVWLRQSQIISLLCNSFTIMAICFKYEKEKKIDVLLLPENYWMQNSK